jgi:transcriptional regulator with XRE-family HTH domain
MLERRNEPAAENRPRIALHNRILSERIKSARNKAKLTQEDLAIRLNMNPSAVGQWETARTAPSTERLAPLADALDVSVDWLLGRVQDARCPDMPVADDLLLLEEARRLNVDLRKVVGEARQQQWRTENREALADANAFLTRNGLWSDGKRQF